MTTCCGKLILHLRYHCDNIFGKGSKGFFYLKWYFVGEKMKKTLHNIYDKKWKENPGNHEMQNGS